MSGCVPRGLLVVAASSCTAAQSARPVAPGKIAMSAAINYASATEDRLTESIWTGELMFRHGVAERVDWGLRVARTPGQADDTFSLAQIEPKVALRPVTAVTTVSVSLGLGLSWREHGTDAVADSFVVTPSVLVGHALSPRTELVLASRLALIGLYASGAIASGLGVSVGLRIGEQTGALYPELAVLNVADGINPLGRDSVTFVMVGVGVGVGN